jgi:hypothetical protein
LVIPALRPLPGHWAIFGVLCLLLAVPGEVLGHALSRGLTEQAGMVSPVLTVVAAAFVIAVIVGGVEIARWVRPLEGWQITLTKVATAVFGVLWTSRSTLIE